MKNNLHFVFAALILSGLSLAVADVPDYKSRPIEIGSGQLPRPQGVIWTEAQHGYKDWKVVGEGTLESGNAFKLWNDTAAKVVFKGPGKVVLKPAGLVVKDRVDGVAFWVICPKSGKTTNTLSLRDANGKDHTLTTRNNSSFWAQNPWWCTSSFRIPRSVAFPVSITEIAFEAGQKAKAGDTLYFDFMQTFSINPVDYPAEMAKLPSYLTTADTILPTLAWGVTTNTVTHEGERYVFNYQGNDGTLSYIYTPKTGTLGDFSVIADGRPAFTPMAQGGLWIHKNGVVFKPTGVQTARLVDIKLANHQLTARWAWSLNGCDIEFAYTFTIKGRSLLITADCAEPVVSAVDCGFVDKLPNPRLFGLTYLNYRWGYPRLLVNNDCFVSLFPDWYSGNASEVVDGSNHGELQGAKVLGESSARILGGLIYNTRNDGVRPLLHERLFLTVAPKLEQVLPNIPNPKSRYLDTMSRMICHTRMYPVTEPKEEQIEVDYEARLKAYGLTDIFYRTHYNEFRTPIGSNNFAFSLRGNAELGGDAVLQSFYGKMKKIFPIIAPYQNNRVIHPLSEYFNYDWLSQWSDNTIISGWDGSYQLNPIMQRIVHAQFDPRFMAKFGWNGCYLDETTNTPPWGLVDFNPLTPGAATYRSVLLNYGQLMQEVRKAYRGPVWSEGNAAFFWAGCADTDYAQTNAPDELPMPDFKLRKINLLECYNGYDLSRNTAGADYLISAQIVHGNIGHIWGGKANTILGSAKRGYSPEAYRDICKSYYMMRQLQEFYCGKWVKDIFYQCGDKLVTATDMLRQNLTNEGKIHEVYVNGLQIWVNRNPKDAWQITVDGKAMTLPPYGYAAWLPGKLLEYSAELDGHRVDYSNGPLYTYLDGRGTATAFPELTAANAYVFRKDAEGLTLTPVPFIAEETLSGLAVSGVTALSQDGKTLDEKITLSVNEAGRASLDITAKAFSYRLRTNP